MSPMEKYARHLIEMEKIKESYMAGGLTYEEYWDLVAKKTREMVPVLYQIQQARGLAQ